MAEFSRYFGGIFGGDQDEVHWSIPSDPNNNVMAPEAKVVPKKATSGQFNTNDAANKTTDKCFCDHRTIQSFRITSNLGLDLTRKSVPKLLSLDQTQFNATNFSLFSTSGGFVDAESGESIKMIDDYKKYRDVKWTHFKNFVLDNGLVPNTDKTVIVSFAGTISDRRFFQVTF